MEPQIFQYETIIGHKKNYFEINDDYLKFIPSDGEEVTTRWSEIESLDYRTFPEKAVLKIKTDNSQIKIPSIMENYLEFLKTVSKKLLETKILNQGFEPGPSEAGGVLFYIAISVILILSLVISGLVGWGVLVENNFSILFLMLLPCYLLYVFSKTPIKAFPKEDHLILRTPFTRYSLNYSMIETVELEYIYNGVDSVSTLGTVLKTKNNETINFKFFRKPLLFFSTLRWQFDKN